MLAPEEANLYPLFLKLEGRSVLVVGAGAVAERKITSLLAAGACVRVVAPHATEAIGKLSREGALDWHARAFEDADADGAWLVIAATSSPDAQLRAAAAATARRAFVVAVDDPANASAYSGAVVERPPFTIAISSSGATPALTRLVREVIEQFLPSKEWIEHAKRLRAKWQAEGTPTGNRFAELVRSLKDHRL
ncbi:MAG: bifunctional precorrin-2 dehydrogenase/sirohydrochlorin ferrochelatase [Myxococcota bacterium]|nr:bifunctional precorrin-2 dehydrogenase/sirohydrochlorin ferrochelatase [Myxococcota bacterium]